MIIYNTVPYFLSNYSPTESFLMQYYRTFPEQFKEYFLYHCKHPDQKIKVAFQKYAAHMKSMEAANQKIETYSYEITSAYERKYRIVFTNALHIIVGLYGSNAFTHRQPIPDVTFCLERLSPEDEHLKVIIAHEFGHVLHHVLSEQEGIDWNNILWFHPYTTIFQEGCATYFSKQLVMTAYKWTYFSYDDTGEDWLKFSTQNKTQIIRTFLSDIQIINTKQIYREWFSIYGGRHYGFSRLGYFIGYCVIEQLVKKYNEIKAITIWKDPNFLTIINETLLELHQ